MPHLIIRPRVALMVSESIAHHLSPLTIQIITAIMKKKKNTYAMIMRRFGINNFEVIGGIECTSCLSRIVDNGASIPHMIERSR